MAAPRRAASNSFQLAAGQGGGEEGGSSGHDEQKIRKKLRDASNGWLRAKLYR